MSLKKPMSTQTPLRKFEQALLKSWRSPTILTLVLLPLSGLYLVLSTLNRWTYTLGPKARYEAAVPTIVVGNLTVGGSGKSPFVAALVKTLQSKEYRVGIVSRGYKRSSDKAAVVLNEQSDARDVGDEPLMLFHQTNAPTAVAADRKSAIDALLKVHDLDVIVCDDGLQHWKLKPSVTICIDDQSLVSRNRLVLPAGPYRELYSRLKQMHEVVAHVVKPSDSAEEINSDSNDFKVAHSVFWLEPQAVSSVHSNNATSGNEGGDVTESLTPRRVNLVAGIAKPQRFFETAQSLGYSGPEHSFSDHHQFVESDLKFDNDLPILMTEKDAVKCNGFTANQLWYLPVTAQLDQNMIDRVINRITQN